MKYCSNCGGEFKAGSKFCGQCGQHSENSNKVNEGNAQADSTPVELHEKTTKNIMSKSQIINKIIALFFTFSALTITLTSIYLLIMNEETSYIYEFDFEKNKDINYELELIKMFPSGPEEAVTDPDYEFQPINHQMKIQRDELIKKIDKLVSENDEMYINHSFNNEIIIATADDYMTFLILPLSSIMFFVSLLYLIISFKETK